MAPQSKSNQRTQLRRNERERKRVHLVNDGFDQLRCRVPKAVANKKLSKADTLREAVKYIQQLQAMLQQNQSTDQISYPSSVESPNFKDYCNNIKSMDYSPPEIKFSPTSYYGYNQQYSCQYDVNQIQWNNMNYVEPRQ